MRSAPQPRKTDTRKALELAVKRIQLGMPKSVAAGRRLSIAAVAEEAGVSNATIHNRYPDIAESIRKLVSGGYAKQLTAQRGNMKECQTKLARARQEIEELKAHLAQSQSINLRLVKEIELLRHPVTK